MGLWLYTAAVPSPGAAVVLGSGHCSRVPVPPRLPTPATKSDLDGHGSPAVVGAGAEADPVVIFADGMHDDLLTQLSRIGDLRVTSRTSVEQFRDTNLDIRDIAGQLGVRYIIEGAVDQVGDRIRVNVQLMPARRVPVQTTRGGSMTTPRSFRSLAADARAALQPPAPPPTVATASISCAARAPDSSAPSIEVESRDVCSPAKWIRPSGRAITGRNSKICPGANEA